MTARPGRTRKPWLDERIAPNALPIRENFSAWFRDSAITARDGAPLPVFHGTDEEVQRFDRGIAYFSDDRGGAGRYGAHIMAVYLAISRPYTHDDTLYNPSPEFIEELKARGHDGIISAGEDPGERYFIAFYPEQVKSATDNSGNFDPQSPCITDAAPPQPRARRTEPSL